MLQLQTAQTLLEEHSEEIRQKTILIISLRQEVQSLSQEHQTLAASEVLELRENLSEEREKNESNLRRMLDLERELAETKEQLVQKQLTSDQQVEQFTEKLNQRDAASKVELEELQKQLQEQKSEQSLDKLRHKLECQENAFNEEVVLLRAKLEEQSEVAKKHIEELNEKLQTQELISKQQMEELEHKLNEQSASSNILLVDSKQKLSELEQTTELLKAELKEAKLKCSNCASSAAAEEELKRLNSDLQTELASLKAKSSNMEQAKETGAHHSPIEMDSVFKDKERQEDEKLTGYMKASAERETELQKQILEKEECIKTLHKSLKEAQERQEEEESQAVQEARRREVERRRELLAVAHEAIAQKDAELEKKAEEIKR